MTIIKIQGKEDKGVNSDFQDSVETKLELAKSLGEVQSRIRKDITSDFVYAKLGDKDKKMITEMTATAYISRRILGLMQERHRVWEWNNDLRRWEYIPLSQAKKSVIEEYSKSAFDTFMVRPVMTAILNRNKEGNFLIKSVLGIQDHSLGDEIPEDELDSSAKDKVIALAKPRDED